MIAREGNFGPARGMNARRGLLSIVLFVAAAWSTGLPAEVYVRWNQAGYPPERAKELVVMATADLEGQEWQVERDGRLVTQGVFGRSVMGAGMHSPLPFNHRADVTMLRAPGDYHFRAPGAEPALLRVQPAPYRRFLAQALQHLRMVRSGSDEVPGRRRSHDGDARAPVYVPDGDVAEGRWRPAEPARTVDVRGGWYDAGDQIKFTLNEAYTTYVLLLAYQLRPELFRGDDDAALPAVLAEARHGLEFLGRVYPDEDTFVIQVGNEEDHNQPSRLPEDDALDGRRPALTALSRVHLASASAALALGARVWTERGEPAAAAGWRDLAIRMYERTRQPGTVLTAFERGKVNDFYRDATDEDQLALAAVELHALTGEDRYLDEARRHAPPAADQVSWSTWHAHANAALAPHDPAARARLVEETEQYVEHALGPGRPWGVPGRLVWASLHRWIGAAHAAARAAASTGGDRPREALAEAVIDYTFGRNPWGVSFFFSRDLPNTVQHIYSPLYRLLDRFPTGALSEGPGNRSTHDSLRRYFDQARAREDLPFRPELERFNTPAAVFADDAADFMCQETTIGGQADIILLLTLASLND